MNFEARVAFTLGMPMAVSSFALMIFMIIVEWKIFEKAGEAGWKILIPLYNVYTLFKIVTGNGWKILFLFIPLFNVVYMIMFNFKMAKAYGQGTGFGFGLLLINVIFLPILAFGPSKYIGPQ